MEVNKRYISNFLYKEQNRVSYFMDEKIDKYFSEEAEELLEEMVYDLNDVEDYLIEGNDEEAVKIIKRYKKFCKENEDFYSKNYNILGILDNFIDTLNGTGTLKEPTKFILPNKFKELENLSEFEYAEKFLNLEYKCVMDILISDTETIDSAYLGYFKDNTILPLRYALEYIEERKGDKFHIDFIIERLGEYITSIARRKYMLEKIKDYNYIELIIDYVLFELAKIKTLDSQNRIYFI